MISIQFVEGGSRDGGRVPYEPLARWMTAPRSGGSPPTESSRARAGISSSPSSPEPFVARGARCWCSRRGRRRGLSRVGGALRALPLRRRSPVECRRRLVYRGGRRGPRPVDLDIPQVIHTSATESGRQAVTVTAPPRPPRPSDPARSRGAGGARRGADRGSQASEPDDGAASTPAVAAGGGAGRWSRSAATAPSKRATDSQTASPALAARSGAAAGGTPSSKIAFVRAVGAASNAAGPSRWESSRR